MAGALIGALRVALGLDSAQFTAGTKKAKQEAKGFASDIQKSFGSVADNAKLVAGAISAIGSAVVVVAMRRTIDAMDDTAKAAQKVGVSAQELTRLQYAADLSGVSAETLQKGLNKLNIAITGMGPGAKGAAAELGQLGVVAGSNATTAMAKLADQFAAMPDGAAKSALAIKLFGKAGAEMIPLLNGGGDAIKQAADEAERYGLVLSDVAGTASQEFNDNLSRMGMIAQGTQNQIATGLLPTLAILTRELISGASVGPMWVALGKTIGTSLINIAEMAANVAVEVRNIGTALSTLGTIGRALARGDLAGARSAYDQGNDALTFRRKLNEARFDAMRADIANYKAAPAAGGDSNIANLPSMVAAKPVKVKAEVEFIPENMQSGFELRQQIENGIGAPAEVANQALQGVAGTLNELKNMDFEFKLIQPEWFQKAEQFADGLARNLSQAIVYGQSLGQALISSIKAAAAELITSGLIDLLLGGRGAGGSRSGGIVSVIGSVIGSVFGFANGTKSAPGGLAMVGERGREIVNLPRGASVTRNSETEAMLRGGQRQSQEVIVSVAPSPLFSVAVVEGATQAAKFETQTSLRRATRPRMMSSMGA
jgi:hypothetical protein